jgi:predicted Rossmann fold flavoprotein
MLAEISIPVYKTSDGWYYPLSNSAHSVVNAFSAALDISGVKLVTLAQVSEIINAGKNKFILRYLHDNNQLEANFDRVIVSTGGKAYPSLGSRGELFPILENLGHTVLPIRPALAPILADLGDLKPLDGVRLDVGATLLERSQKIAYAQGNVIFTKWGLNGPAVMDISHQISARPHAKLTLSLNLLAFYQSEFDGLLGQKRASRLPLGVFLGAFFPPKVSRLYLKNAHLSQEIPLCEVNDNTLHQLIERLKDTRFTVNGVRGFEYCQVSAGGVPVTEVDPQTMESRRVSGLFLTGETLDVVGPCGGYNLHFAFASGALAWRGVANR